MTLIIILLSLLIGCILAPIAEKIKKGLSFYLSIISVLFALVIAISIIYNDIKSFTEIKDWIIDYNISWIPLIGANFHVSIDGFSYIMIILTLLGILISFVYSDAKGNEGYYYFNSLLMTVGVVGIFMANDLFLFFVFWEMMLVPIYFLIVQHTKGNDNNTAFKFLLYTQLSGLFLFLSIATLHFIYLKQTGLPTFEYSELKNTILTLPVSIILMMGFVLGFGVKMPIIFVHGWLPSVFKDAPISVILTGILIKTAVYGFIRFGIPLFFDSSYIIAPLMMALGVITIFYGAFIAYSKTDFRQFIAYSTLSHMGFSLIGLYSLNEIAWQGVVIQMFASFFSGAALFILAKIIYKQTNTYNLNEISGLWSVAKNTSGFTTFFVMLSLGLPGLISFVAEFLILVGVFNVSVSVAVMSSIGIILAAAYSLRIIQKLLIGEKKIVGEVKDMNNKEYVGLAFIMIIVIFMGIYTKSLTNFSQGAIKKSLEKPIEDYRDIKYKNSISVETKFLK